jgi:anti-sigma-K factor RskA
MMEPSLPFDHRADPELGAALRAALEPGDPAPFVARVLAQAELTRGRRRDVPTWDILARWARAGIAAAAVAALVAGFAVGRAMQSGATLDDVMVASAGAGANALLSSPRAPDASVVFTSLVERER